MAEWLKAHAWRACERVTVPWVRIPLCPLTKNRTLSPPAEGEGRIPLCPSAKHPPRPDVSHQAPCLQDLEHHRRERRAPLSLIRGAVDHLHLAIRERNLEHVALLDT